MQIQDIEVILLILSLIFLCSILKLHYKQHVQLKTVSNITYSTFSNSSYLHGTRMLEPRQVIVRA